MSGDRVAARAPPAESEFRRDALEGLAAAPSVLSGKYLWDERGSQLFDEITRAPGYYATSTETTLLASCAGEIADLAGPEAALVEFGSGTTNKIALLLEAFDTPRRYIGIDISQAFSAAAGERLRADFPSVEVAFVVADFSRELPPLPLDRAHPVVGVLLGCAIGNMAPPEAVGLLARIRHALGDGLLLVGQDPNHDAHRLQAAYGGPAMAAFHLNILTRLKVELGATLSPEHFRHEARLFDSPRRIEAHLVAIEPTEIAIGDHVFAFGAGDTIRTDVSLKLTPDAFAELARAAGWSPVRRWIDPEGLYGLHLLRSP